MPGPGKFLTTLALTAAMLVPLGAGTACDTLDDNRIPWAPVSLVFYTMDEWNLYGIGLTGAMGHRRFIKSERIPANYSYRASEATGYGGLLLVGDIMGNPMVYDLACPVECMATVRVEINSEYLAECPKCHSTYDVFSLNGHPQSGVAAERGYGLTRYRIGAGGNNQYMVISD